MCVGKTDRSKWKSVDVNNPIDVWKYIQDKVFTYIVFKTGGDSSKALYACILAIIISFKSLVIAKSDKFQFHNCCCCIQQQGPSLWCAVCQRQGHLKQNCPDDTLPEIHPLPPLTSRYKVLLDQILRKVSVA